MLLNGNYLNLNGNNRPEIKKSICNRKFVKGLTGTKKSSK